MLRSTTSRSLRLTNLLLEQAAGAADLDNGGHLRLRLIRRILGIIVGSNGAYRLGIVNTGAAGATDRTGHGKVIPNTVSPLQMFNFGQNISRIIES